MNDISNIQRIQEDEYIFPYHHIMDESFNQNVFKPYKVYLFGHKYLRYVSEIIRLIDSTTFNSLLDVGCGDGCFLKLLTNQYNNKILTGIDYSIKSINFARSFDSISNYVIGDITSESVLNNTKFDIITSIHVWEHIPKRDLESFITSHKYLLNKNGILIVSVPLDNLPVQSKHYQHFNIDKLKSLLIDDYHIEDILYVNCINNPFDKLINFNLRNKWLMLKHDFILNFLYNKYSNYDRYHVNKNNASHIIVKAVLR